MAIASDSVLDCRGLSCPQPVLKTKKAIEQLQAGQVLELIATDPATEVDILAWSRRSGNQVIASEHEGREFRFWIRKQQRPAEESDGHHSRL